MNSYNNSAVTAFSVFNCFFKFSAIALVVAMMATVVSCGSKDDDSEPSETPTSFIVTIIVQQLKIPAEAPTLSITPSVANIQFSATGNVATSNGTPITPTFTVETNQSEWDVNSSAPTWLTATKSETGFTLTAAENNLPSDRTATVTVSAAGATNVIINVSQKSIEFEDITGAKLTNYAMPFQHKSAIIIDQGNRWNYDVDGGWLYNTAGGSNGVVFANQEGSYNCTLTMQAWASDLFPVQNMVNGKLYQTAELEAGYYRFTANLFAAGEGYNAYVVAASGDIPDTGAVSSALGYKQIPTTTGAVTVEFTLSQKTTVSLGFVATMAGAEFHVSSVQLM